MYVKASKLLFIGPYSPCTLWDIEEKQYVNLQINSYRIPDSYLPSLVTCCENMASNSERIMEKTGKFQIVYAGRTNPC